jgi:DNA-directed RNA polymerase specialized sigma24 family protein
MDAHSEWLLVQRCRAQDATAWRQLFFEYHPRLVAWIQHRLRTRGNIVDEITEAVWFGLVSNPRHLKAFNPARSTLFNYLALLAVHYMHQRRRSERSRAAREQPLRDEPTTSHHGSNVSVSVMMEDFLSVLPPTMRELTEMYFLASEDCAMRYPSLVVCMEESRECLFHCCISYLSDQ